MTGSIADPVMEMQYRDAGCHVHPHCLSCPLPECIYDSKRYYRKGTRVAEALNLMAGGMSLSEVSRRMDIGRDTLRRWRKELGE